MLCQEVKFALGGRMSGTLVGPRSAPGAARCDQICSANCQKMQRSLKIVILPENIGKFIDINNQSE